MNICVNCFSDEELKGFISSSSDIGDCDFCESKNQSLLSVGELFDFFQELTSNFQVYENGESLISKIQSDWKFFSSCSTGERILNYVLPKLGGKITSSNINVKYIDDITQNLNHWEDLKEELKLRNRFITNIEKLVELGWDGFFNTTFELNQQKKLFRARLHDQSGMIAYEPKDMFGPPEGLSNGGRANPSGISFLYLSEEKNTTLYEVRVSYLDELSIGTFELKNKDIPIRIVDFTASFSLYRSNFNSINETMKAKLLRCKISDDLSKPMRRYDSKLEYIPTQFICEFIKIFTGTDGIRFSSSLDRDGNNLVLFNQEKITCILVEAVKVSSVKIDYC